MTIRVAAGIRALAVIALFASACGSSPAAANGKASSPNPTPPAASHSCSLPSNPCLALVNLRGSNQVIVGDITDITHPKTLSTLKSVMPQFISAADVSWVENNTIIRKRLTEPTLSAVVSSNQGIRAFAWSPDGKSVVYVTDANPGLVHLLIGGSDRIIGSVRAGGVGGCEGISGCSLPNWRDLQLSFSPDGSLISLVVDDFSGTIFRIWSSEGKVLKTSDDQGTTMATWSGEGLYFRDSKGVEVWRNGVVSPFLPGVMWIKPKGSPSGGQIVYTARDSAGWGQVFVVDISTRETRLLKAARTDAVFLTSRYIWYRGERACVVADYCGPHPPFHPVSGKTYIYDLQNGTETESIITSVYDVWPHAA